MKGHLDILKHKIAIIQSVLESLERKIYSNT